MLARAEGHSTIVWAAVGVQIVLSILINFSYGTCTLACIALPTYNVSTGCIFIFITASAPNKASLGTVNGLCQVGVSIMRTIGPALGNSLFSLSIDEQHHYLNGNLVYAVLAGLVFSSLVCAEYLPKASDEE